jgi:hypothetical protein
MMRFVFATAATALWLSQPVLADNPWGPECKTLEDCLVLFKQLPDCPEKDQQCFWSLQSNDQGIGNELGKFDRAAVPPLLEIIQSGAPTQVARAAGVLHGIQEQVQPKEREVVLDAWRRGVPGLDMLASSFATPEFVNELMLRLRKNPVQNGVEDQIFENLRDFDDQTNGIQSAVAEHIECSSGEPCEPRFAKLQLSWLISNFRNDEDRNRISTRFMQAIKNPKLDVNGKIAALQFFRPNEYGRTKQQLHDTAVPFLNHLLKSHEQQMRQEAAVLLSMYENENARDELLTTATDATAQSDNRIRALGSLMRLNPGNESQTASIENLLNDPDWDIRRNAIIFLGVKGNPGSDQKLMEQISATDWRTAFSAVTALNNTKNEQVKLALQHVSTTYWHPTVRATAFSEPSTTPNLAQYPDSEKKAVELATRAVQLERLPSADSEDYRIQGICKARFKKDGYSFVPDFITGPEVAQQADDAATSNWEHFKNSLLGLPVMHGATKLGLTLEFQGWNFVGTAGDSSEGKLIATGSDSKIQTILIKDVQAIFEWNKLPYAIAGGQGQYPQGDAFMFELTKNNNGAWQATPKLRLTGIPEVWLASDQTIGILGSEGVMLVHSDGSPEWVGCPQPSFP